MTAKHTPGPYIAHGSAIYASTPQDVDHSAFKGFDTTEPSGVGYLIAESIPHGPTRNLLAAAPDLLVALMNCANWAEQLAGDEHHPAMGAVKMAKAAIAKALGEI